MNQNKTSNISIAFASLSNSKDITQSKAAIEKIAIEVGFLPSKRLGKLAKATKNILAIAAYILLNFQGFIAVSIAILLVYCYYVGFNEAQTAFTLAIQFTGCAIICRVYREMFNSISHKLN